MTQLTGHVVVVDDDEQIRSLLRDFLREQGHQVSCFASALEALRALRPGGALSADSSLRVDVILSDLKMSQLDGMAFLKTVKEERRGIPVILITGHASIDTAIEAMRSGAYDYVVKPFQLSELSVVIHRALEHSQLERDNTLLRKQVRQGWSKGGLLGKSAAMRVVFDLVERVAPSTANVLITGESGTGKEMVARAIHDLGPRANKPFVAINCTAIPDELLESELFGHVKGAFTGAVQKKKGLVEEANGGTLFLDEIGDMPPSLQAKLLRVLQDRKIRPVGETQLTDVDVRIIAATHKDLKTAIREERFREDLFYRLSVIPIALPPLRDRVEDIPLLAEHFLAKYAAANIGEMRPRVREFSKAAMSKLISMRWPGNVRELENLVERVVVLANHPEIDASDIPDPEGRSASQALASMHGDFPTLQQLEQRYMEFVLQKTAGRKDKAAQILGVNRRTLYRKEREFGWVNPLLDPEPDEHSGQEHPGH